MHILALSECRERRQRASRKLLKSGRAELTEEASGNQPVRRRARSREPAAHVALVSRRRLADQRAEPRAKRTQAFVTHGQTNFGDRQPVAGQQLLGSFDAQPREELMGRLAEDL